MVDQLIDKQNKWHMIEWEEVNNIIEVDQNLDKVEEGQD